MMNGAAWQDAPIFLAMAEPMKLALVLFVVAAFALFAAMWQNGRRLIASAIILLAALIVFFFAAHADAHDHARPDLDTWFQGLQSRGRAFCCDGTEVKRLDDVDWENKDGHYRVRIDGEWIDVPDDAVITEPNLSGRTMVWPVIVFGKMTVRCFIPGSMT